MNFTSFGKSYHQSVLMGAGTIVNSLLGLIFYVLVARILGVGNFGELSFYLALGIMAAEMGDLGFSSTIIKFGSGDRFRENFSLVFFQRLLVSCFLVAGFVAAWLIFNRPLFVYSAAVAISLLFFSWVTQAFLARQFYVGFISTNVFGNLLRLVMIYFLPAGSLLTVMTALVTFSLANFSAAAFGYLVIIFRERSLTLSTDKIRENLFEVWDYTKYIALSFAVSSAGTRIDVPIIYLMAGNNAAGLYSSAQKLISVLPQISAALEGVFAPKMSIPGKTVTKEYLGLSIIVSIGLIVGIPVAAVLIPVLFGVKYLPAIPIFNILILGLIPFFLSGPFAASILYRFGKSNYHLGAALFQLVLSLLLYFIFVPALGAAGAAITFGLVNLAGFVIYVSLFKKFSREEN